MEYCTPAQWYYPHARDTKQLNGTSSNKQLLREKTLSNWTPSAAAQGKDAEQSDAISSCLWKRHYAIGCHQQLLILMKLKSNWQNNVLYHYSTDNIRRCDDKCFRTLLLVSLIATYASGVWEDETPWHHPMPASNAFKHTPYDINRADTCALLKREQWFSI